MFDTRLAAPFTIARFQLLYDGWVGRIVRSVLLLSGLAYGVTAISWSPDLSNLNIGLVTYIWGLLIFWEIFFQLKIRTLNVGESVGTTENLAASFSTRAAKILLEVGKPDLAKIFLRTLRTPFAKFVTAKLGLSLKDFKAGGEWGSWDSYLVALRTVVGKEGWSFITEHDLLSALANVEGPFKIALFELGVKEEDLRNVLFWAAQEENARERRVKFWREDTLIATKGIGEDWAYGYTLALDRYSRDITSELTSGRLRPYLVGRDLEIDTVTKILARHSRQNVLLVGEPGVGKSTIVQALAMRSLNGLTLTAVRYKRFLQLDLTSLLSSAGPGEVEQRTKDLLTDAERAGNIVLVIPDISYLVGAGEGVVQNDLSGLFLQALQGNRIQVIALTDHQGFTKYLEPRKSFVQSFETVEVAPASVEQSIRVLEKIAPEIESRQALTLTYAAIKAAAELSQRYLPTKDLPGKAIDLLDEAAVEASSGGKNKLDAEALATLITRKTRIPLGKLEGPEKDKLLNLEAALHERVVGQDQALQAVSGALRRARAGLRDERRPIGVYLFLGPTGVGKTETAKAVAAAYFGNEKAMIRLDMSEYASSEDQVKLIGANGESGKLTEAVTQNPFSLILLDEVEKASPKILDTFLQVFDEGRLTDGSGRTVDFTNDIIIATSNAGAEQIREIIKSKSDLASQKGALIDQLLKSGIFRPEFLNRFDEIVLFEPLSVPEIVKVVQLMLRTLDQRLKRQDITLEITDAAVKKIAEAGYDPIFGARPLRRYIQDHVEGVLAKKLLEDEVKRGDTITLDVGELGDLSTQVFK